MQRARILGLAIVIASALSGIAVASASASSFLVHPTGKVLGSATSSQQFTTAAGTFECTKASIAGATTALKSLHLLVQVQYSSCTEFGLTLQLSPALYLLSADLKASVENDIVLTLVGGGCTMLIGPAGNQNLNSVHYGNEGADLKVNFLVQSITFTSTGGLCGSGGTNMALRGGASMMSATAGGVIRWDKE